MFLLILVQIYKKNRGKPHVGRNIYKEKTYIIRWRLIFGMKKEDFQPLNATLFYRKVTELSHVVQERAEGPKTPEAARPVRAKALCLAWSFKAFALTGRHTSARNNPGRCPGLGASALSGRVGLTGETGHVGLTFWAYGTKLVKLELIKF